MAFYIEIPDFSPLEDEVIIPYGADWCGALTGMQLVDAPFPKVRKLRTGWEVIPEKPKSGKFICSPHHLENIPFVIDESTVAAIGGAAKKIGGSSTDSLWIHFYEAGSRFYVRMRSTNRIDFWTLTSIAETHSYRQKLAEMIAWLDGRVRPINTDLYKFLMTFLETHRLHDDLADPLDYQAILSFASDQWLSGGALDGIAYYFQRELGISPQGERTLFIGATTMQLWMCQYNNNQAIDDSKTAAFFQAGPPDRVYAFALINSSHWIFYRVDAVTQTLSVGDNSKYGVRLDDRKYADTTRTIKAFVKSYFPSWKGVDNARLASIKVPRQDGVSCGIIAAFAVEHDILFKDGCHGWEDKDIPIYRAAYLARVMGYEKVARLFSAILRAMVLFVLLKNAINNPGNICSIGSRPPSLDHQVCT